MSAKLKMEKSQFPQCWKDDTHMELLFSEIPANSVVWQAKIEFWCDLIQDLCRHSKNVVVSHSKLCSAFRRKYRSPKCLDRVLQQLLSDGRIMNLCDFKMTTPGSIWEFGVLTQRPRSLGRSVVKSMMKWAKKEEKFILLPVVDELAAEIDEHHNSLMLDQVSKPTLFLDDLAEECKHICTGTTFRLALIQLQKKRKVELSLEDDREIVKFRNRVRKMKSIRKDSLLEYDRDFLKLQNARISVLNKLEKLKEEISLYNAEIKNLLKSDHRSQALLLLKKKKRLEICARKKSDVYDNIEKMLSRLERRPDIEIVDAYRTAARSVKKVSKDLLAVNRMDEMHSEMEEALEDFDEIQAAITKQVVWESSLDEFEDELNELIAENSIKETAKMKLVPSTSYGSDKEIMRKMAHLKILHKAASLETKDEVNYIEN